MPKTTPRQAYNALKIAADKIGQKNYRKQMIAHKKRGKRASTFKFRVTPAHQRVVNAMPKALSGKISVEKAMSILHEHDIIEERF